MRIKEVCKETGLTDKAIRFYINHNLINPDFTENYSGRKNYYFNEDDVNLLKKIAILRRYNFAVNDIKEMLNDYQKIPSVLEMHLNQTKHCVEESSMILTNLNNAYDSSISSVDELCDILSENLEPNNFDIMNFIKSVWEKLKRKIPLLIVICSVGFLAAIILLIVITIMLSKLFMLLE